MTLDEICIRTGLVYCGTKCPCGAASGLLFFPVGEKLEPELPDWMNGSTPEAVAEWLNEHGQ